MFTKVENFKYFSYKFPMKIKMVFEKKLAKCAQIPGILNNNFKPTLIKKFSRAKVYNALSPPTI